MAYNENLSQRVRTLLGRKPGIEEKKMFGGTAFLLHGNMTCGILNDYLIVRVGPKAYEDTLKAPHTRQFDITGKVLQGWVMVAGSGYDSDETLASWVRLGIAFAGSLPKK